MKILFFSPTPLFKNSSQNNIKVKRSWVSGLIEALTKFDNAHKVSVAFHDKKVKSIEYDSFDYFKIAKLPTCGKKTNLGKLIDNWTVSDIYKLSLDDYLQVIQNFNPDIIQIFGIEHPFIRILGHTGIPVVIHLQGLIAPYTFKEKPRYTLREILFSTKISNILKGDLPFLKKIRNKKHIKLEESLYDKCKYFLGRTNWDKLFSKAVAPNSFYYHCQEIMRNDFYDNEWDHNAEKPFKIFSTLGNSFRKNADMVFVVAGLLEKFHKNFNFEWQIAGVDYDSVIARIVRKKGFNTTKVRLLGKLDVSQLIAQMLASNLFVFPSAIDNSPNALQEAMLIGMPVIASHAGGVSSLINHNNTGILVPEGEPYSMAGAIVDTYDNYEQAKQMGKKAREVVLDRNDPKKIVKNLLNIYTDIIRSRI
jgi:glycosyltransferase involved in cell wall biosynthesis